VASRTGAARRPGVGRPAAFRRARLAGGPRPAGDRQRAAAQGRAGQPEARRTERTAAPDPSRQAAAPRRTEPAAAPDPSRQAAAPRRTEPAAARDPTRQPMAAAAEPARPRRQALAGPKTQPLRARAAPPGPPARAAPPGRPARAGRRERRARARPALGARSQPRPRPRGGPRFRRASPRICSTRQLVPSSEHFPATSPMLLRGSWPPRAWLKTRTRPTSMRWPPAASPHESASSARPAGSRRTGPGSGPMPWPSCEPPGG
jgi:hypothetical protein